LKGLAISRYEIENPKAKQIANFIFSNLLLSFAALSKNKGAKHIPLPVNSNIDLNKKSVTIR
jgi:hypothetical protein